MLENNIVEVCQKFNETYKNECSGNSTEEGVAILQYFNIDLSKAIIKDVGSENAKHIAKIILGFVD